MARRPSLSMLILQTAERAALLNCSSEMPTAASIRPPNRLIRSTYSGMTVEAPCSTMGNPDRRRSISSRMSEPQVRRFLAGLHLEFEGPMGGADGDGQGVHPRLVHEFFHLPRLGIMGRCGGDLVSTPASTPNSASTVTSRSWA